MISLRLSSYSSGMSSRKTWVRVRARVRARARARARVRVMTRARVRVRVRVRRAAGRQARRAPCALRWRTRS
tara:strand:- start:149 stop:364 length:216 start_codon:yes stop_codon:yes gene_type:complete